tara:strand:+ start:1125 stop:1745 length:621 start_codon:yes stop_codon:yes gene_type:complete
MNKEKDSFGMISASRVSSTGQFLFGSDIKHSAFVTLTISTATFDEEKTNHHIFTKDQIVRVAMTAVQWADLLCNMNTTGVPCTIERRIDKEVERYEPSVDKLGVAFRKGKEYLENATTIGLLNDVRRLIEDSKLSKKAKSELEAATRLLDKNLKNNAVFYLSQFIEESTKVVIDSKAEVEANRTFIMKRLGEIKLDELKNKNKLID